MYTLIATDRSGRVIGSVEVLPQPQLIGRGVSCALILNGGGVSRHHAAVQAVAEGVVIEDRGSANGVYVDGQAIAGPTLVDHQSTILISDFVLRLESGAAEHPVAEPVADGPAREAEDFDTRLEIQAGAGAALARTTVALLGRGGSYDGTRVVLEKPLNTVGRDDDCDVTLEDPSVSRRHAQLRLAPDGNRLTVVDLRSSNGTFIDGQRIKRAEAGGGSIIRFGELAFSLQIGRSNKTTKTRKSGRGRVLVAALGVLALLGGVATVAYLKRPVSKKKQQLSPEELLRRRQARVQRRVEKARTKMAQRQWSPAIAVLDEVLGRDPLNAAAKRLRKKALDELANEQTFEKALKFFALGNRENLLEAKSIFNQLPDKSIYAREARYKLRAIDERLAEGYRIDGLSRCRARYYMRCYELLCKFFELQPGELPVPGESGLRKRMKRLERRLHRKRSFSACKTRRYLSPPSQRRGEDPVAVLKGKYDVTPIRHVIEAYYHGKVDAALKQLAKLRSDRTMRPHLAKLSQIDRKLLLIRGKYQEGYSFVRQRRVKEADREWSALLAADRALIPAKLESFYRREVKRVLARLYADLAGDKQKVKHYRDAFALYRRGKKIDPSNHRVLNGLLDLEKVAERLVRDGRKAAAAGRIGEARAHLTRARDICEKGRSTRREAERALSRLGQ